MLFHNFWIPLWCRSSKSKLQSLKSDSKSCQNICSPWSQKCIVYAMFRCQFWMLVLFIQKGCKQTWILRNFAFKNWTLAHVIQRRPAAPQQPNRISVSLQWIFWESLSQTSPEIPQKTASSYMIFFRLLFFFRFSDIGVTTACIQILITSMLT